MKERLSKYQSIAKRHPTAPRLVEFGGARGGDDVLEGGAATLQVRRGLAPQRGRALLEEHASPSLLLFRYFLYNTISGKHRWRG